MKDITAYILPKNSNVSLFSNEGYKIKNTVNEKDLEESNRKMAQLNLRSLLLLFFGVSAVAASQIETEANVLGKIVESLNERVRSAARVSQHRKTNTFSLNLNEITVQSINVSVIAPTMNQ